MTLHVGAGLRSGERNAELFLLAASVAFIIVAERALDAAAVTVPSGFRGILTQFLVVMILGHVGLRILAPGASRIPYAVAMLLTAVGLAFVARLSPATAQDQAHWVTLGVIVMLGGVFVGQRYTMLRSYKYTAALVAVALLFLTGIFGETINGARLQLHDDEVGSIAVGKAADLVVLDKNLKSIPIVDINTTRVLRTFVDGVQVYAREAAR